MELNTILDLLSYRDSPNFLRGKALGADRDFGHIFRKAQDECGLKGVYILNASSFDNSQSNVPVVYVCEAGSETEAREIHRKVWNQNAVPFLLVISPGTIRLYPGFRYRRDVWTDPLKGALRVLEDFNLVFDNLEELRAESIDSGSVWRKLGGAVTPEKRVDWQLLANLRDLNDWLRNEGGMRDHKLAHAMIGKFVYIYYLRQRKILSDNRLRGWGIDSDHIFGHSAQIGSFIALVQHVDEWLNGGVFPLSSSEIRTFGADNLSKVASVFAGEQTQSVQLPLFDIYDFSFIPIETLSVIYEQFLHDTFHSSEQSEGEARGAYYTPVPLVNFMLDKLDARMPLEQGMKVLDPSCGSGAFLVQCFRKLIERRRQSLERRLRPAELGRILTSQIFGVDIDEDACQIAELSLALTLLEYIDPPDLTETQFKLPALRDRNIFHANAFDDQAPWYREGRAHPFQWVVGNPPWKDLNPNHLDAVDEVAWQWIKREHGAHPVGGNQLAEAFLWRASEVLSPQGCVALLIPAMTLFKYESMSFRKAFLAKHQLWSVANFANLAEVLFGGRSRLPAAAFFYSPLPTELTHDPEPRTIEVYTPLVANLPASQSEKAKGRKEIWNIVVNSSDLRRIDYSHVSNGDPLPWKLAMWGSTIDRKVLSNSGKRFRTLGQLEDAGQIVVSQGLELRQSEGPGVELVERHLELADQLTVDVNALKNRRYLLRLPSESLTRIERDRTYVRIRGGFAGPMRVNQPPHVIVGASRTFAIYTEEFLVVPPRQVGIVSADRNKTLLRAIALYLNSDFVAYHQFFAATEAGVQKSRNTLKALRALPMPFDASGDLKEWEELYARISKDCRGRDSFEQPELVQALNDLTADCLKLSRRSRAAVHDMVRVRFGLIQGKTAACAVGAPERDELQAYARMLRDELDAFVAHSSPSRHRVDVLFGGNSGLVSVDIVAANGKEQPVRVLEASERDASALAETRSHVSERRAQWLYFNRDLRVYDGPRTYILKPAQHLHWTRTQAIRDAGEIIADSLHSDEAVAEGIERR